MGAFKDLDVLLHNMEEESEMSFATTKTVYPEKVDAVYYTPEKSEDLLYAALVNAVRAHYQCEVQVYVQSDDFNVKRIFIHWGKNEVTEVWAGWGRKVWAMRSYLKEIVDKMVEEG
jgi:hypothetical protein